MKIRFLTALILVAISGMLLQGGLTAGDKKDGEKKDGDKKEEKKQAPREDVKIEDALTNADLKDKVLTESFHKTYVYKMTKGNTYQIDMITRNFDAFLRLEDPKGTQVAADDDSGGMLNARIIYRAPADGDYTICAMSLGSGSTGKYTLLVKELVAKDTKPIQLKLEKGQVSVRAELTATDARYGQGQKIHKAYAVTLEKGKKYQIDHIFPNFDAYLYLEGPDGQVLAQDDDGGEGLNSRIIHTAANDGTYRIIATSLGGRSTGAYTLTVREVKD